VAEANESLLAAQELLQKRAKKIEQASAYKSEFIANMSHDLRTPLNSILILSGMLADNTSETLTPKQVESATTIHNAGQGLLTLINDIMDLSKVEAGKLELVIEPFSLRTFLENLEKEYSPVAEDKGLAFSTQIAEDVPIVIQTDGQRLGQIVKNLLSNALKFTKEGSVSVNIERASPEWFENIKGAEEGSKEQPSTPEKGIAISVHDTGIGIPEDKQELIFGAFRQADGTTSRAYGGTGLGLSISLEMSALLGGVLRLDSVEGQGSCFTLFLPLGKEGEGFTSFADVRHSKTAAPPPPPAQRQRRETDAAPDEKEAPAPRPENGGKVSDDRESLERGDHSILIVEDDKAFARLLRDLCQDRGFKCLVSHEGGEAVSLTTRYLPSGILLDLGLPDMSGMRVIERLKDNLDTRHIPIHVVSASENSIGARKVGAADVLRKPVDPAQVHAALNGIEERMKNTKAVLLMVDDDPVCRKAVRQLIESDDVEVVDAETGEEALKRLDERVFSCVVLDLKLPGISGTDVLNGIRKHERVSGTPVIVYTGAFLSTEERMIVDKYADKIVIKGVGSPELLLDQATLFMHRVTADLPLDKQRIIRRLHDKEAVFQGRKILVVDDDIRNVFALTAVLEEKKVSVIAASNGVEALELLEANQDLDMVLMDIMMPEMDGYECMTKIRQQYKFKDLPILALTAKAMKEDRSKCIESGATDYLTKPIDTERLLSMLRVWLYR